MSKTLQKETISACLQAVHDPSQNSDIVTLGYVAAITVKDSNVNVVLEVPSHRAAAMEAVRKQAENALHALDGVTSATVILTAHQSRQESSSQTEEQAEHSTASEKIVESKVRRFIAVGSGKGGVGKSTTAVNLAIALKLQGLRVGILDADVYGPSQPRMLGVSGKPPAIGGDMVAPLENYGIKLMSMGLLVPDDTAMIWRGPMVQSALTQMLNAVEWGELDVIVIDLPPGTGDIQISLAQQVNLAGAVIVSTPQDIALLDVIKAVTMFEKAQVPILGMVQNMAVWCCPDCGRTDHIFGKDGVEKEAGKRGIEMLGEMPLTLSIRSGGDAGVPVILSEPDSAHAQLYLNMAKRLIEKADLDPAGDTAPASQAEAPRRQI